MRNIVLFVSLFSAVMLSSCEHLEIYREGKTAVPVIVTMDWRNLGSSPSSATIYFYPEDGGAPHSFKTNSVAKASVNVPSGYYTVLVFNRTVDEFATMHFEDLEGLSLARAMLDSKYFSIYGTADSVGRTVHEPEQIVVGRSEHFYVSERTSGYVEGQRTISVQRSLSGGAVLTRAVGDVQPDTCKVIPERRVMTATIKVRVEGLQNIKTVSGYLTGMAGGMYLATGDATDNSVTHVIESWTFERDAGDYTKGYLVGTFSCFGLPEQFMAQKDVLAANNGTVNKLHVKMLLVDNKTVIDRTWNVSDRVVEDVKNLAVELTVGVNAAPDDKPIDVPTVAPEGGSESGFDVTIKDWTKGEDVVVPM